MARIFTVDQAAEYLQISPYTVRVWLRTGKIPGCRMGRIYRILEEDLEGCVRQNRWRASASRTEEVTHEEPQTAQAPGKPVDVNQSLAELIAEKQAEIALHGGRRISAFGKHPRPGRLVEDFMREKHEEIEEEDRRSRERHRA